MTADDVLVEVRLRELPVAVHASATAHLQDLRREFVVVLATDPSPDSVPGRVADLARRLEARFAGHGRQENAELADAVERGDTSVDLAYWVPPEWADACREILDALTEVDAYCRQGALLTLRLDDEHDRYLRWLFGQFIRQVDGSPATTWSEWVAAHPLRPRVG